MANIIIAIDDVVYSFPNRTLSISFENIIRKAAIGMLRKNTHFPITLLISLICFILFFAYNSVIMGTKRDINAVGINTRRFAVGKTALYNPTSDIVLNEPINHV